MDPETRAALNQINLDFYDAEADAFSGTRDHAWPGWTRLVSRLRQRQPVRVLDVGCGNARFALFLRRAGIDSHYTGIDASQPLLEVARARVPDGHWMRHDLILGPHTAIPAGPFDCITLFGVMHHIPGETERRSLLQALAERLAPGGHLVFTSWQFARDERFAKRARPIEFDAIDPSVLEPGDQLLQWGSDPNLVRYCHDTNPAERARLLAALPLELVDEFESDGRSSQLNHYAVLQRPV